MSEINYQVLREKAEKATRGEWSLEYGENRFDGDDALIHREAAGYIPICRIEGAHPEAVSMKISKWNSRPMLNSSPQPIRLPCWHC
ncbi:ead/Ea22-like family protein [Escherichia coli]|uniref:ead/Ea22-like family protein n=1 Tax=Escherichia coli TaxID=562 RepID=UPI00202140A9|nr:ead/Ea22-like family protein [Escherichia coli]